MANFWDILLGNHTPEPPANNFEEFVRESQPNEGEIPRFYAVAYDRSEDVTDLAQLGIKAKPMRLVVGGDIEDSDELLQVVLQLAYEAGKRVLEDEPDSLIAALAMAPMEAIHEYILRKAARDE